MKEFIKNLIDRLEEEKYTREEKFQYDTRMQEKMSSYNKGLNMAIGIIKSLAAEIDMGNVSDGYHTFNELYHHRAVLFSVICNANKDKAWKSKLHDTGDMYEGMFIVGIETPNGQATYHYDINPYWDMFDVNELPKAPKWDGHSPADAIERIGRLAEYNDGWIPFTQREATEDEKEFYGEYCEFMLDCILPDEDEEILVTYANGIVGQDVFLRDGHECYLDSDNEFVTEAIAWRPLPKPYHKEGGE